MCDSCRTEETLIKLQSCLESKTEEISRLYDEYQLSSHSGMILAFRESQRLINIELAKLSRTREEALNHV